MKSFKEYLQEESRLKSILKRAAMVTTVGALAANASHAANVAADKQNPIMSSNKIGKVVSIKPSNNSRLRSLGSAVDAGSAAQFIFGIPDSKFSKNNKKLRITNKKSSLKEEGLDSVAGVKYDDDNVYRYKVGDLVKHTKSSKFKKLSMRHFKDIESQIHNVDPKARKERIDRADPSYPIIVMRHKVPGSAKHQYQVLDGTHRVAKALAASKKKIAAKIVDRGHMQKFYVPRLGQEKK